ncbi:hypothetical protein E3N88_18101 [Mikania micrantha]|uniref:Uncharacterized protein n=1 Tax=Mikania micrantha TaxID=192012 RepID=A0A5N6NVZ0_9ASTR|nr:hypothetical protein E3N88_18101 [Mikania micrantha]
MGRDSYWTNNMISGKWRDLQCKVAKFNGVWVQHHNNHKSGENDESVMNETLMTYARENESFSHIAVWQVMRKSTKWHPVPKLAASKRTKTSSFGKYVNTQSDSTGRCFVNLIESDEEVEMDMPLPPSPKRPPCRNNNGRRQACLLACGGRENSKFEGFVIVFTKDALPEDKRLCLSKRETTKITIRGGEGDLWRTKSEVVVGIGTVVVAGGGETWVAMAVSGDAFLRDNAGKQWRWRLKCCIAWK